MLFRRMDSSTKCDRIFNHSRFYDLFSICHEYVTNTSSLASNSLFGISDLMVGYHGISFNLNLLSWNNYICASISGDMTFNIMLKKKKKH